MDKYEKMTVLFAVMMGLSFLGALIGLFRRDEACSFGFLYLLAIWAVLLTVAIFVSGRLGGRHG